MPTPDGQLTAAEIAALYALVQTQAQIRRQLMQIAASAAAGAFRLLRDWYDTTEIILAVLQALRVVQPAQQRMAQVTDAYMARVLSTMTGRAVRPIGGVDVTQLRRELTDELAAVLPTRPQIIVPEGDLDLDRLFRDAGERPGDIDLDDLDLDDDLDELDAELDAGEVVLRAVNPVDVYSRVAAQYRYERHLGVDEDEAIAHAVERAESIARTDITLADRAQANQVLRIQDPNQVIGYRRILHPELSETGPCGLCIVAADRKYRVEDLMPLHDRCVCTVLPILRGADPGLRLNDDDLKALYKAGGGTGAAGLKRVRAVITEHGELGPVLAEAPKKPGGTIRGPRRAAKARATFRTLTPEERIPGLEKSTAELERRLRAGERRLAPAIQHQRDLIADLRRQLVAA